MIPNRIKEAILDHVYKGTPCGTFVTAVLENNLRDAIGHADEECYDNIMDIVSFCYNKIPCNCWGSDEIVEKWRKKGGDPDAYIEK